MKKTILGLSLCFLLISYVKGFAQETEFSGWTSSEITYYKNLKGLVDYIANRDLDISKDTLFNKYIYFDNVLSDTIPKRKERRIRLFDTIFYYVPKTIDSLGAQNLNAKPIRFFKGKEIYRPFEKALKKIKSQVFVYYLKEDEDNPIGYLLFEEKTCRLASWILLKQGEGSWFFLTFNLL